ncbi:MAG: hypothetical protein R3C49_06035 [Planctomycetaceae bacterium]
MSPGKRIMVEADGNSRRTAVGADSFRNFSFLQWTQSPVNRNSPNRISHDAGRHRFGSSCLILAVVILLSGCSQPRKFLQMNSNSPLPFLGLEFSVDGRDRSAAPSRRLVSLRSMPSPSNIFGRRSEDEQRVVLNDTESHRSSAIQARAITTEQIEPGDRISLPEIDLTPGGNDRAEVDEILSRFANL